MNDALTFEQFDALVASYGADPERWPAARRRDMVGCLVDCDAARAAWRTAAAVDADLDSLAPTAVSAGLLNRVTAIGDTPSVGHARATPRLLRNTVGYAAAAAVALVVGLSAPSPWRGGDRPVEPGFVASAPAAVGAIGGFELTELALVDVSSLADGEAAPDDDLADSSLLDDLPLL